MKLNKKKVARTIYYTTIAIYLLALAGFAAGVVAEAGVRAGVRALVLVVALDLAGALVLFLAGVGALVLFLAGVGALVLVLVLALDLTGALVLALALVLAGMTVSIHVEKMPDQKFDSYVESFSVLISHLVNPLPKLKRHGNKSNRSRSRTLPLDVSIVGWVSRKLQKIAPEEWKTNQDWLAELMESRQYLLTRYPRKVVAFITIWRLVPFTWHVLSTRLFEKREVG